MGFTYEGAELQYVEMARYYVYILANKRNGALYVGVTNDLKARVKRHKGKWTNGFTKDYEISKLVYFEEYEDKKSALARENQLKKWNRRWKIRLIERLNPTWEDLCKKFLCI
jgi:putative endonuclease